MKREPKQADRPQPLLTPGAAAIIRLHQRIANAKWLNDVAEMFEDLRGEP